MSVVCQTSDRQISLSGGLGSAVRLCREALKERTRDRVPLHWATTQNNLGSALCSIGERESGTERLEEAVGAYKAALKVFQSAHATYYAQTAGANLRNAKAMLQQRLN